VTENSQNCLLAALRYNSPRNKDVIKDRKNIVFYREEIEDVKQDTIEQDSIIEQDSSIIEQDRSIRKGKGKKKWTEEVPLFKNLERIREHFGIKSGIPIDYDLIGEKNMADYFKLTIYLQHFDHVYKWGDYKNAVYLKLFDGHYYEIKKKKMINATESNLAYYYNQRSARKTLQPSSTSIMADPIDSNMMIHVMYLDENDKTLVWLNQKKENADKKANKNKQERRVFTGSVHDFVRYLLVFYHENEIDDLSVKSYTSINKKTHISKKIVVNAFDLSDSLFSLMQKELKGSFGLVSNVFQKEQKIIFLKFLNIVCIDLSNLFQTNYLELAQDCAVSEPNTIFARQQTFDIIAAIFWYSFNCHVTDYVSIPSLAESIWKSLIKYKSEDELIHFLDGDQYEFTLQAIRGARNYPTKHKFQSDLYDTVLQEITNNKCVSETTINKMVDNQDYMVNLDSWGHYTAAMINYDYPAGPARWLKRREIEDLNKAVHVETDFKFQMGLFEVGYIAPKNLRHPILMRKIDDKLISDLENNYGVYSSVELNLAIKYGYQIDIITKGLVWNKTCKTYFTEYAEKIIKLKTSKEPIRKRIGKLLLNSLYGRLLYRVNFNKPEVIRTLRRMQSYIEYNDIIDFQILENGDVKVQGYPKNKPDRYNVPIHLGVFVLSYSKLAMLNYVRMIDPTLTTRAFYYTDTDSLFLTAPEFLKLSKQGVVITNEPEYANLGHLKNDLPNGKYIVKATFLAPKMYCYIYITNSGTLEKVVKTCGLPREYVDTKTDEIIDQFFDQMKTIDHYSPHLWDRMKFVDGEWYPNGGDDEPKISENVVEEFDEFDDSEDDVLSEADKEDILEIDE